MDELCKNELTRLAVIYKEISRLEVECLKRNYKNVDTLDEQIKRLNVEKDDIIKGMNLIKLAAFYDEYKNYLTKAELEALGRVLLELQLKKSEERRSR